MRRILLISNPAAARTHVSRAHEVAAVIRAAGCEVDVVFTDAPGGAVDLARAGVESGVDAIAVYGGDGTMMQTVEGMRPCDIPLGLIPGGTGNLLARNLGLPQRLRDAALVVATGSPRKIDLGQWQSEGRTRYFAVACGAGYDAQLMAGTTGPAKRRWGMGAYVQYVVRTMGTIRPLPFNVTVDGEARVLQAALVVVANCRTIVPPFLGLGPDIRYDDGWLNVVALRARGMKHAAAVVFKLLRNAADDADIVRLRGRDVRIEADPVQPVQLDGEPDGRTPFRATILPKGLKILMPARS
jgi:YegS/Rv2252/BmrU family lipid kinase